MTLTRTTAARAFFLAGLLMLATTACQTGRNRTPVRDTWMDPDASVPIIDVAIARPHVASKNAALIAPVMREAARRTLLDDKGYSILSDPVVDAALGPAGIDGTGDASVASNIVDADCVVLISVSRWDTGELIPRGRIYASGSIRAAARPNGRRVFEHTFQDEVLLSPASVTQLGREEAEKQMAADLVTRALASFRRKT
jgi:hypothetical protein